MADQIPRAGTETEIYIFPTITVPPTAVSEQYGLQPDLPEPDPANRTKTRIGIAGALRDVDASANALPITIQVEGIATLQSTLQRQVARALASDQVQISDLISRVLRSLNPPTVGIPVPRFSVKLAGDASTRGVETNFIDDMNFPNLPPPVGYVVFSSTSRAPAPSLCIDRDGAVLCAYIIQEVASPFRHKIACARFDQATDAGWTPLVTDAGMDFIGALNSPQVALVLYRGDVYALVTDAAGAGITGYIYVFRLEAESGTFIPVSGPCAIGTANGVIANGGLTATALGDRVVVAVGCYSGPQICFREVTRTIWIGQTSDLATWSTVTDQKSGFVALDAFRDVLPLESDGSRLSQKVNRVTMYTKRSGRLAADRAEADDLHGWAVTEGGRIYATLDGGASWSRQLSPVVVPLYDVQIAGGSGDAIRVYACGASGCVMRTDDSGKTWKVISIAQSEVANVNPPENFVDVTIPRHDPTVGDGPFYAIACADTELLWIAGENRIIFTGKGGNGWRDVAPPETQGQYTSIAILDPGTADPTTPVVLVGGSIQRQRTLTTGLPADLKRYRLMRFHGYYPNKLENYRTPSSYTFMDELTTDAYRIEAIWARSATQAYAVGRGGVFRDSSTLGATTPTWGSSVTVPGMRDLVDIAWRQGVDDGAHEFLIMAADGLVYRSVTSGYNWVLQHASTETIGRGIAVQTTDITKDTEAVIFAAGGTALWRTDLGAQYEALPSLTALPSGEIILATANLGDGRIMVRLSRDRGLSFAILDLSGDATVTFPAQTQYDTIDGTSLRPSTFVDEAGQLVITAGQTGVVCPDGRGDNWLIYYDPRLPLPLGGYAFLDSTNQNRSRQTIAFGGGRYLSVTLLGTGAVETRLGRQWVQGTDQPFCPIVPGVQQWVGLDDLRVIFDSISIPIGEVWSIPADYRSPARNLVVDTRSQAWRGLDGSTEDITIDWDRRAVGDSLPPGDAWSFTSGNFFGSNFRHAEVRLSNDLGLTFPTDPTAFITLPMSADVETVTLAGTPGTDGPQGVLRATGAAWVPSCFRPGVRQYYVEVAHGAVRTAYRILDNTPDALIVERDSTSPVAAVNDVAVIYTDRMVTIGEGGLVNGIIQPPVMGSPAEFATWVRIFIPNQPTAEGFKKIETAILGRHVPNAIMRPEGLQNRDRFDAGWRWKSVATVIEERSAAGQVAIAHLGRPIQAWELNYGAQFWWDRDATLGPLLAQMRSAFALMFDSADPLSIELVYLESELPGVVHSGADLYNIQISLAECV